MPAVMLAQPPPPASAPAARAWALRVFVWSGPGVGDAEQGLFAQLRRRLPGRELALLRPGWDSPDPEPGVLDVLVVPVRGGTPVIEKQIARARSERSPLQERFDRWMSRVPLRVIERDISLRPFLLAADSAELRIAELPEAEGLCDAVEGLVLALEQGQSVEQARRVASALVSSRGGPAEAIRAEGGPGAVDRPLFSPHWRPLGWPNPGPDAGRILQESWLVARSRESGFVGVEHLLEVLARLAPGLPKRVLDALSRSRPVLRHYAQLEPRFHNAPCWDGTPRLVGLGRGLNAGFGVGDLARALLSPESPLARALVEGRSGGGPAAPARALEVYGGPEDGRRLQPEPGQHLGRGPEAGLRLYEATARTDPWLGGAALEWVGPGRIVLDRTVLLQRGPAQEFLGPGVCELLAGDVVALTRATRVRGIAAPSG